MDAVDALRLDGIADSLKRIADALERLERDARAEKTPAAAPAEARPTYPPFIAQPVLGHWVVSSQDTPVTYLQPVTLATLALAPLQAKFARPDSMHVGVYTESEAKEYARILNEAVAKEPEYRWAPGSPLAQEAELQGGPAPEADRVKEFDEKIWPVIDQVMKICSTHPDVDFRRLTAYHPNTLTAVLTTAIRRTLRPEPGQVVDGPPLLILRDKNMAQDLARRIRVRFQGRVNAHQNQAVMAHCHTYKDFYKHIVEGAVLDAILDPPKE